MLDLQGATSFLPTSQMHLVQAFFDDVEDACIARAPGRVNLLGDHTDYNDGFVLPATIDRAVYVALRPRYDKIVCLQSLNFEEEATYTLSDPSISTLPSWARYIAGVTEEIRVKYGISTGFEGIIYGDVPVGAGLSSSAALEVATAMALEELYSLSLDPVETAQLCQAVEQQYAGVDCGIMDQFAARLGQSNHALFLDCRSLDYRHIPLKFDEVCLVIADSRVSRELASSKYNERRGECDEAVRLLKRYDANIENLRDVSKPLLMKHRHDLPLPLFRRARHVVTENRRVQRGSAMLTDGCLSAFGKLMNASHDSLRDDYEVSAKELDLLVEAAQSTEGVLGARMTGAGFGGCIVCLTHKVSVSGLQKHLQTRYEQQFEQTPEFYVVQYNMESALLQPL